MLVLLKTLQKYLVLFFFDFRLIIDVVFNIVIYAYDTLQSSSKCDQASDLRQQPGALSGLLISLLEKFNLIHLTSQITLLLLI